MERCGPIVHRSGNERSGKCPGIHEFTVCESNLEEWRRVVSEFHQRTLERHLAAVIRVYT